MVEATYVGNRGVWFTAPELDATDYNALTPQDLLKQYGLNINNAGGSGTPVARRSVRQR